MQYVNIVEQRIGVIMLNNIGRRIIMFRGKHGKVLRQNGKLFTLVMDDGSVVTDTLENFMLVEVWPKKVRKSMRKLRR